MRNLSATLKAAQKSQSTKPHPQLKVYQAIGGIARLAWSRYYAGAEDDYFHAVTMPADGSLIRLRADSGTDNLYIQRVTSPGSGSTYSAWTDFTVNAYSCAACSYGVNVWIFYVDKDDGHIYRKNSADSGATYGAWQDMGATAPASSVKLSACSKSLTEAALIYSVSNVVYRRRLSGGTWEPYNAWSNSVASVTGLACWYQGDWNVIVTGTEVATLNPTVWSTLLGDGYGAAVDTWGSLKVITYAEADSDLAFKYPCLAMPDVFRSFWVEGHDGTETYSRPDFSYTPSTSDFVDNLWREPVPFNLASDYGVALCHSATHAWLTRPDGVWCAEIALTPLDLTTDVLLIHSKHGETNGSLVVHLRNDDGRMDNIGDIGDGYELIKLGAELRFSPGYHSTAGGSPEHSDGPRYWITGYHYISLGSRSELILEASDAWAILDRWKARRQFTWDAGDKNIFQLLSWVAARAGLELSSIGSSSAAITAQKPRFTIPPGQSGRTTLLRLLSMVEEVCFTRGEYLYLKYPQSGDSSDYTYGTDHDILAAAYHHLLLSANRAQVKGDGVFTEDFDWNDVNLFYDSVVQVQDLNLGTAAKAHQRGDALITGTQLHADAGNILVPLNCGQEVYDVVTINDPRAPLSGEKRRVVGLEHLYHPAKGVYSLKLNLGAVA